MKICDIAIGSAAFQVETCRQLGDELVKAWRHHGDRPALPEDETEELLAMRLIVQRCLYGVDRNPMAVDLAKLSLWLATLAKEHPFTFLDHSIRCGDSLIGLSRKQIEDFTWQDPKTMERHFFSEEVRKRTTGALRERQNLLALGDDYTSPSLKREKLGKADELLDLVRFIGDAALAAFFTAERDKVREAKRVELADRISQYLRTMDLKLRPTSEVTAMRGGLFPVTPFHWEIEFPEVFERENPGFDAIVGNPPFLGGKRITTSNGEAYLSWLLSLHDGATGGADLVAHFFRRAFTFIRQGGTLGLIATNTIRQGDTRNTSLRWIRVVGHGAIYAAQRRSKWPGAAAVVVSVLWIIKQAGVERYVLDGQQVPVITAFLFTEGSDERPAVLSANANRSFIGSFILGMGFTFDDTDSKGVASSLADLRRLIDQHPRSKERIFPYLGGEEVNDHPSHHHHRYVADFADFPLRRAALDKSWSNATDRERTAWVRDGIVPRDYPNPVASDWPELLELIEQKVKPERTKKNSDGTFALRDPLPRRWWQYADKRPGLYRALSTMDQCLVCSLHSKYYGWALVSSRQVFSHGCVVFPLKSYAAFCALESKAHDLWGRFFASTLEDRLRYTPSDCFETFPFPDGYEANVALEKAGRDYYKFRAALMLRNNEGLTKTYNRLHDPEDRSPDVLKLRELHAAMDAAVLAAYGWDDLIPKCMCQFLLDYEDEGEEDDEGKARKRRKPWRYRWPDEVRDEVLARLLKLNAERAEQERLAGEAVALAQARSSEPKGRKKARAPGIVAGVPAQVDLLPGAQKDLFSP